MINIELQPLQGEIPYELMLLADETLEAIEKYIHRCVIFTASYNHQIVASLALETINTTTVEIKNLAVKSEFQQQGIGGQIMNWLKDLCKEIKLQNILVGTGDASIENILFYQKCGFEIESIRKSFYLKNYDAPILENGIQLKHMLVFKYKVENE